MTTTWALCFFIASEIEASAKRRTAVAGGFLRFHRVLAAGKGSRRFRYSVRGRWRLLRCSREGACTESFGAACFGDCRLSHHRRRHLVWSDDSEARIAVSSTSSSSNTISRVICPTLITTPAPIYYYLVILILLALPWTAFIIDGSGHKPEMALERQTTRLTDYVSFALVWILLPLIFFSFSSSKLPGYILPVLPAHGSDCWRTPGSNAFEAREHAIGPSELLARFASFSRSRRPIYRLAIR